MSKRNLKLDWRLALFLLSSLSSIALAFTCLYFFVDEESSDEMASFLLICLYIDLIIVGFTAKYGLKEIVDFLVSLGRSRK